MKVFFLTIIAPFLLPVAIAQGRVLSDFHEQVTCLLPAPLVITPTITVTERTCRASKSTFPTSTLASPSTAAPACGQPYLGSSGTAYQIQCNLTYSGAILAYENASQRRTFKRAAAQSFEACIADCDSMTSCMAAAYTNQDCILFSTITAVISNSGAQAAVRAAYAASITAILNNATTASVQGLTQVTPTVPPSVAISQYVSQHDAQDTPIPTSPDNVVYVTPAAASSVSSSSVPAYSSLVSDYISDHASQDFPASTSPDNVVYLSSPTSSTGSSLESLSTSTLSSSSSLSSAMESGYIMSL